MSTTEQKQLGDDDVAGIDELGKVFQKLKQELAKTIVGQDDVIERLAICLFARGHAFCLLYTSPSPRDLSTSRMPSSA